MTRTTVPQRPSRALVAGLALCWLFYVRPASAGEQSVDASDASGFRIDLTGVFDDNRVDSRLRLGLDTGSGSEWVEDAESAAQGHAGAVPGVPFEPSGRWAQQKPIDAPARATAAGAAASDEVPDRLYGWKQLQFDLVYVYRKPAHLDARDRRAAFAIAGTTGLLYVFREDIQEAWQDNRSDSRTDFLNSARIMGGAGFAPAVALAAFGVSFITDNDRELETAQLVLESWALSAVGSGLGSFVLAVERPEDGDAIRFFALDGHGVSYDVSVAASVIPPLRRQYLRVHPGDAVGHRILKHGLSALLYSGMVFTMLQRIDANKHWAPDVFLGMVNGLGVGRVLGQAHDEARERRSTIGLGAVPGGLAVTCTVNLDPR